MNRIKKQDKVQIISGKYQGKNGEVVAISRKKAKVKVKDIGLVSKHYKARKQGETSTIKQIEQFIPMDKVMPVCVACNKPTRVGVAYKGEERVRVCQRCRESF